MISGATVDNLVFKPQVELGTTATGYEEYKGSSATATLDTQLTSGEYIDVINKKRYSSDGTQTNITVEGELKTIESGSITIDCTTQTAPPKIDAEYWQDINKVIFNADGYYEKGVLTEEDLAELQALIDEKNTPAAEVSDITEELAADVANSLPVVYHYTAALPDWARSTVQKLLDRGILSGSSESDLNLTEDMLRILVINDRAGLYE